MSMRDAVQYARKMRDHYLAFEEAEKLFEAAAQLEQRMAELEVATKAAQAEYAVALAAKDEMRRERDQKMAIHKEAIENARAAAGRAEAARDKAIAAAQTDAAEARKALAVELEGYRAKCAVEMADLGKQIAALRDERDSLQHALSELKRLAAR